MNKETFGGIITDYLIKMYDEPYNKSFRCKTKKKYLKTKRTRKRLAKTKSVFTK